MHIRSYIVIRHFIPLSFLQVIKQFKERGHHHPDYSKCGRPERFDNRDLRHMRQLVVKKPRATVNTIKEQMGATVSLRIVQRDLNRASPTCVKPHKFVLLLDGHTLKKQHYENTVKDTISVMICACFSVLAEPLLSSKRWREIRAYIAEILTRRIIPQINDCYPSNEAIFQQDNAPCHVG